MKEFIIHGLIPSKKNSKQISVIPVKTKYGTKYKPLVRCSDAYNEWHKYAVEELQFQQRGFTTDRCKIIMSVYFGDLRVRDADNAVSSIFDTLKDAGIIEDDNWKVVYKHIVECDYDKSNPRCEIKIYNPEEQVIYNF